MTPLAVLPIAQAERLIGLAARAGIAVEKFHNKQTCRSGCGLSVEVWANECDLKSLREIWKKDQQRNYLGLNYDPKQVQQVFDTDQESAICPACGFEFATTHRECPDCGLCFG